MADDLENLRVYVKTIMEKLQVVVSAITEDRRLGPQEQATVADLMGAVNCIGIAMGALVSKEDTKAENETLKKQIGTLTHERDRLLGIFSDHEDPCSDCEEAERRWNVVLNERHAAREKLKRLQEILEIEYVP